MLHKKLQAHPMNATTHTSEITVKISPGQALADAIEAIIDAKIQLSQKPLKDELMLEPGPRALAQLKKIGKARHRIVELMETEEPQEDVSKLD